jgi:hypothetical protein
MMFTNICYSIGFIGGCIFIISGVRLRSHITQKSKWASLVVAGAGAIIWSVFGEIFYWSKIIPQAYDSVRVQIGGITVGILVNMVLSRQTKGLTIDLFSKRLNSSQSKIP